MSSARLPFPRVLGDRVFYGWAVVAAVFVMLTTSAGLGFYNATVYLRALVTERGFALGAASGATAVFFLVSGIAGVPISGLIARRDPRPVMAAGAVLGGLALLLLGRVQQLWQLYAAYAVFGVGFAASALVPGMTVVTRWFARRRAVALSVASTGLSVGGVLVTPLSAALVARWGLSGVAPWFALAYVLGVLPITALLVRPDPGRYGLWPDGDRAPAEEPNVMRGTRFREAVRAPFFLAVTAAFMLVFLAQVGALAHLFNLVSERVDERTAAATVSTVAGGSVVGRLLGGWALQRVSLRGFSMACALAQGLALFVLAGGSSAPVLLAGAAAFGLTVGNLLMLHSLLLADGFGVRDFPRIYSASQLLATVGVAAGPLVVGVMAERLGGYGLAVVLAGGASLVSAAVLFVGGRQTA
jgi:MFS family permease